MDPHSILGIDFGAQNSGNTAVAYLSQENSLAVEQSKKGQNSDTWLLNVLQKASPSLVFIDAPLSLPREYSMPGSSDDFFYRDCDKELDAMSPLFLGGLTARAMRFAKIARQKGCLVHECYPKAVVTILFKEEQNYKKNGIDRLQKFLSILQQRLPVPIESHHIDTWHKIDAILAWYSGFRFANSQARVFGDETEGVIVI